MGWTEGGLCVARECPQEDIYNFLEPHRICTRGVLESRGCEGESNATENETSNDEQGETARRKT